MTNPKPHKSVAETLGQWTKLFADVGTALIGVAAIWGLIKASDTFEKVVQISSTVNELKTLTMEVRSTLGSLRDDLKAKGVKESGAEKVLTDPNLNEQKTDTFLQTIPRTWSEAVSRKTGIFIPDESRKGLVNTILENQPQNRSSVLEAFAVPAQAIMTARMQINGREIGFSRDPFNLFDGIIESKLRLAPVYRSPLLRCRCVTISGDRSGKCNYDPTNFMIEPTGFNKASEVDIVCQKVSK